MHREIEAKAWIRTSEEEERVRGFLEKNGKYKGKVVKKDIYFSRPKAKTFEFRLRQKNDKYFVNQKNHKLVGNMEHNEELEFEISNGDAFVELTKKLGYVVFLKKTKYIDSYKLGSKFIAELLEVPTLGKFLEVEIVCDAEEEIPEAEKKIKAVFEELDLEENIEKRQYAVLLKTVDKS